MLCYSCGQILFSGYDSFDSVDIRQAEFFQAILDIERKIKPPREFICNSVLLALGNDINRYTLWEELLEIIEARLDTAEWLLIKRRMLSVIFVGIMLKRTRRLLCMCCCG
jgi:hypothetical protein